jgi:3-isopropylmalate dehydrogenase
LLLRYGLGLSEAADLVDRAIWTVLQSGARTADLDRRAGPVLTTSAMGQLIARQVEAANAAVF